MIVFTDIHIFDGLNICILNVSFFDTFYYAGRSRKMWKTFEMREIKNNRKQHEQYSMRNAKQRKTYCEI